MLARRKPLDSSQALRKLTLLRPRFVYVRVRVRDVSIPIFVFVPLSLLELAPRVAEYILRREPHKPETEYVLQALRAVQGQTWELRKLPPFALVEAEVKNEAEVQIGIW